MNEVWLKAVGMRVEARQLAGLYAVLVREAGVPFLRRLGNDSGSDPFFDRLSLMEVAQMLCLARPK